MEMVRVKSVKDYFREYAVEGIGKGADRYLIRQQLIDAFHKEMFGLVSMRTKKNFDDIPKEKDPEAMRITKNIVKETTKKWMSLIKEFEKYKETSGLLKPGDLAIEDDEEDARKTQA